MTRGVARCGTKRKKGVVFQVHRQTATAPDFRISKTRTHTCHWTPRPTQSSSRRGGTAPGGSCLTLRAMGDDTGDDEALARALAAQEEEHAYALGVAYPTFRPPAKRRRPDPPGKTAKPKGPEAATEPPSALVAKKQRATVTLAHLIDYGVVVPGENALATSYCDVTTTADLEEDGTIVWRREKYRSVSAFSLAFKRSVKPDRKADDGWKCVRYVGGGATGGSDASVSKRGADALSGACGPAAAGSKGDTLDEVKRRFANDGSERAAAAARGDGAAVAAARARCDAERVAREAAKPPEQKPIRARVVKETAVEPKTSKPPPRPKPKPPPPLPIDRPRRARKPSRRGFGFFGATSDLQMIECERYEADEQPWAVTCSFEALALMDFHAHLSSETEIIGFLGGTWDAETKTLRVLRALPARRLPSADAGVEVELDPASVPEIVDALESSAQRVVGWYHSHPTFATSPSLRDCENQSNYQALFAEAEETRVPFVGAIVGPYREADPVAEMTWFHVDADAGDGVLRDAGLGGQPKEVRVDRDAVSETETPPADGDGVFDRLRRDAFALAEVFGGGAERVDRVDLDQPWGSGVRSIVTETGPSSEMTGGDVSAKPSTRLTGMLRSLRARVARVAPAEAIEAFVDAVAEKTRSAWRGEETRGDA